MHFTCTVIVKLPILGKFILFLPSLRGWVAIRCTGRLTASVAGVGATCSGGWPICLHLCDNLILPSPLIFCRHDESCVGPSRGRFGNSFGGRPNVSNESDSD